MRRATKIAVGLAIGISLSASPTADAADYRVVTCNDTSSHVNHSWAPHNDAVGTGQLETGDGCVGAGDFGGLFARDALTCGDGCAPIPSAAYAGWTFSAPSGATIVGLSYSRWLFKMDDDDWRPALLADGAVVDGEQCNIVYPAYSCERGAHGGERAEFKFSQGKGKVDLGVYCAPNASGNCLGGATLHQVAAVLYGATVTLSDPSSPTVSDVRGDLFADGFARGSRSVSFDASDNSGVRSSRLVVDGVGRTSTTYTCDFTFVVPCSAKADSPLSLDTTSLSDGTHSVRVAASDAAGNEGLSAPRTVAVDNSAPPPPQGLSVIGGEDWRPDNSFSVTWTDPSDQVAPVSFAHYELCDLDTNVCEPSARAASSQRLDALSVPSQGAWLLRVWLEDAAGNADRSQSSTVVLRYGTPPAPSADSNLGGTPTTPPPSDANPPAPTEQPAISDPVLALQQPATTTVARQSPRLRLTSARYSRGHLVLRGRSLAPGSVRVRFRSDGHTVSTTRRLRGGAFRLTLRSHRTARVRLSFGATPLFLAQTVSARVRSS